MKFFNKKVSLGLSLAVLFVVASGVYSLGYKIAMDKLNQVVSNVQEKQKMYGDLSEIDYSIKNEYIGEAKDERILSNLYLGYVKGLEDENCKFLTNEEYVSYMEQKEKKSGPVMWDKINSTTGYVKFNSLNSGCFEMFSERTQFFESGNIKKMIIDLRTASEGNFEETFKILKHISPEGDIVFLKNKFGEKEVVCKSGVNKYSFKTVILVGDKSCGAAEVLAMAMRDSLGAKTVGLKTAGLAVREKNLKLSDNSVLVFPDASYETKSMTQIYKNGVTLDENIQISEDDMHSLRNYTLSYTDDAQLQGALYLLEG